jgi:CubicO group peptidase (beta-lactamase class C family)
VTPMHPPVPYSAREQQSRRAGARRLLVRVGTGHPYAHEIDRRIIRPLHLTGTTLPGTFPRIPGPHPHGYVRTPTEASSTTRR